MEIRLLGPVGLHDGDADVAVGGPRAQSVLALLAVRADEVVTPDWLIDQIWGEHATDAARSGLQSYLSRLRALVGTGNGQFLARRSPGYVLDSSAVSVDARRFAQLARAGASRADLTAALALWRGTPFAGLDEVPALAIERDRMEGLRVEARLAQLRAELTEIGPAQVIGRLRDLTDERPWDERAWHQLVLALYRAGRQTESLQAAARFRHVLADEQGLEPSRELVDLEQRILRQDGSLLAAAEPVRAGTWLQACPGVLVGRNGELVTLRGEWAATRDHGRARLVLVRGEPGIGKSSLVAALAHEVGNGGATVLAGRCLDHPRLPLQPFSELVERVDAKPREPHELVSSLVEVWEVAAYQLFAAVVDRIADTLRAGPAVLVAEDLHWAGAAALRLLEHVLDSCARLPLLVLATTRSVAAGMTPETTTALGELIARVGPRVVELSGLPPLDLQELLAGQGHTLDAEDAQSLHERTGGVPLLAIEAMRGGFGMIDARLARLSRPAADVAELIAVAGDTMPVAALAVAAQSTVDELEPALAELDAEGLIRPATLPLLAFEFSHALYRDAIGARLGRLRTLVLARRMIAAARTMPRVLPASAVAGYALILAESGEPTDVAQARDECVRAGAGASAEHDHAEAVRWLRSARAQADRLDPDAATAELDLAYGLALRRAGMAGARDALLRAAAAARTRDDWELLARIGVGWSRGFFARVGAVDREFVAVLRDALAPGGRLPDRLRAVAMAALAAELTWSPEGEERFAIAEAALALARATGDLATLGSVLRSHQLTIAAADTLTDRRRATDELLEVALRLDDLGLRFEALFHRCGPAIELGDIGVIEDSLEEAGRIAEALRQPALQWSIGWSRASLLLWHGNLVDAEKLAVEACELGVRGGQAAEATVFLGAQRIELARLRGTLGMLGPALAALPQGEPDGFYVARHLCDAGRVDDARARLGAAVPVGRPLCLRRDLLERPALDNLAHLATQLGRTDLVDPLRCALEPLAETFGHGIVAHPVGHHWLGVLATAAGRPDDAVWHLRRAVSRHRSLGLPLLEAESAGALVTAYADVGDATAAAATAARAKVLATAHGAAGLFATIDRYQGDQR